MFSEIKSALFSASVYVVDSDEVGLLSDAVLLSPRLLDRRVIAVFLVVVATYLWTTMDAMARARAEAERQRLEVIFGCEGRPKLRDMVDADLFPSSSVLDVVKNVRSKGRVPLKYSRDVYVGGNGAVWRSSVCEVLVNAENEDLRETVCSRVRKQIDEALLQVKQGGRANVKIDQHGSKHYFVFVDLDDSECFINFFDSRDMTKRSSVLSLAEVTSGKCDVETRSCFFVTSHGKGDVFMTQFESDGFFYAFALFLAHLRSLSPR